MNDAERLELPHIVEKGADPEFYDEIKPYGYYDKRGNNISFRDWIRISVWDEQHDRQYKIVGRDTVGPYLISTVWLGLNHNFGYGPPLIFETMVFNDELEAPPPLSEVLAHKDDDDYEYPEFTSRTDLECERYATEDEARQGHQRMVEKVSLLHEATKKEKP